MPRPRFIPMRKVVIITLLVTWVLAAGAVRLDAQVVESFYLGGNTTDNASPLIQWLEPANWSAGTVPGASTLVRVGSGNQSNRVNLLGSEQSEYDVGAVILQEDFSVSTDRFIVRNRSSGAPPLMRVHGVDMELVPGVGVETVLIANFKPGVFFWFNDVNGSVDLHLGRTGLVHAAHPTAEVRLSQKILGPGGIIKTGPGTLFLNPSSGEDRRNEFTGDFVLRGGAVTWSAPSGFAEPRGSVFGLGTLVAEDGTTIHSSSSTNRWILNSVELSGHVTLGSENPDLNGTLRVHNLWDDSRTTLLADTTLNVLTTVTWEQDIAGAHRLIKDGPGTLILAGNNTFAELEIRNGTVSGGGTFEVIANGGLAGGGGLELRAGSGISVAGQEFTLGGALIIGDGASFRWDGEPLAIPAGGTLTLNHADARFVHNQPAPLVMGAGATIRGRGSVFNFLDLGESSTALLQGDSTANRLRVVGRVIGNGTLQRVRLHGRLSPGYGGAGWVALEDVHFVDGTTVDLVVAGPNAHAVIAAGSGVNASLGRLVVRFAEGFMPDKETTFPVIQGSGASALSFATVDLPPGWELDAGVLHYTGRYAVASFGQWARSRGLGDSTLDRWADPRGDGIVNLRRHLFGVDPDRPAGTLAAARVDGDNLRVAWNRIIGGKGDYFIEAGSNLGEWAELPGVEASVVEAPAELVPYGYERVEASVPVAGVDAQFIRVGATEFPRATVYPGTTWEVIADPESVGVPQWVLDQADGYLSGLDTTGCVVVVGGRILYQYGNTSGVSYVASVRKSILSMLMGKYVASGQIDLDETMAQLGIDDNQGLLEVERIATVRDLLRARSGVYHPASNSGDNTDSAPPRGSQIPGEYYLYNNWDFNALGSVFTLRTGLTPHQALHQDFAIPLQMQDFSISQQRFTGDSSASMHLAYHMYLSTRDMARIGLLMLRDGVWNGERIIPEEWMGEMLFPWTPTRDMNPASRRNSDTGYGYLWWLREVADPDSPYVGSYAGHGFRGQYIMVVPKLDLVLAHKTYTTGDNQVTRTQVYNLLNIFVSGMSP